MLAVLPISQGLFLCQSGLERRSWVESSSPPPFLRPGGPTKGSSVTLLAGLGQTSLADPVVGPLADVVIPPAVWVEVGTVLASAQPVPLPVVWLAWLPVPERRRQQQARKGRWSRIQFRGGEAGSQIPGGQR